MLLQELTKKQRAEEAVRRLKDYYPDAVCSLTYERPHELLISVRLAAQCTDARVNTITPTLFAKYPTLHDFAVADPDDVAEIIRPCGFFKTKSKDIVATCKLLEEQYGGVLPDTVEELIKLPGIGRKTANLIVGDIYGKPAIVCDTHCIRITNRLGFVNTRDPAKCEQQLRPLLPPEESNNFCHRLVHFGREICTARKTYCEKCPLAEICPTYLPPSTQELSEEEATAEKAGVGR